MTYKTLEKILIEEGWTPKPDSLKGITTGSPYFIKTEEKGLLNKIVSIVDKGHDKIYLFDIIKKYTRMIFDKSMEKEFNKNPNLIENLGYLAGITANREAIVTSTHLNEDHLAADDEIVMLDKKFVGYTKFNIKTFSAYPEKIKINTICIEEPKLAEEMAKKDPAKPKTDPVLSLLEAFSPNTKKFKKNTKGSTFFMDQAQLIKHQQMMGGMNEVDAIKYASDILGKFMTGPMIGK